MPRLYCPEGQLLARVFATEARRVEVVRSSPQTSGISSRAESVAQRCSCRAMGKVCPALAAVRVSLRNVTSGEEKSAWTSAFQEKLLSLNTPTSRTNSGSDSSHIADVA